jgi:hypothetical protein
LTGFHVSIATIKEYLQTRIIVWKLLSQLFYGVSHTINYTLILRVVK